MLSTAVVVCGVPAPGILLPSLKEALADLLAASVAWLVVFSRAMLPSTVNNTNKLWYVLIIL